eukprot:gene36134-43822_t
MEPNLEEGKGPRRVALSFKQLGISSLFPPKPILSNVSGYVLQGGITAIMGASASGKSVLMQVIAGRLPLLHITGSITLGGVPINPTDLQNDIAYVPQNDFLMGELSARETLLNSYLMKRDQCLSKANREVDSLLKKFGLDHVADNAIGTVFKRGLSGGQRKRVEVCSELVAPPSVLLLDEPTSGLDGAIAYDVLFAIKSILAENKNLSLIISIHQPNSRILDLFDNILLVGGGGMIFFGTLPEAKSYFAEIGFPAPEAYTPTDVFLQVSDTNFGDNKDFDFEGSFACHALAAKLNLMLDEVCRDGMRRALMEEADSTGTKAVEWKEAKVSPEMLGHDGDQSRPSDSNKLKADSSCYIEEGTWNSLRMFVKQFWILLYRDFTLAYRDPSLYYLQFILVSFFGFLVGACFFRLKASISAVNDIPGGLLWIVMMMCYIQVFKVYHLNKANSRFKLEISNNTYSVSASFLSELTATCILLISFIPGTVIAYFMMDLPSEAYPFLILVYWMTALTSESMLNFITKFSTDATVSVVASQGVLVILTVFGGGMFISWEDCPIYWRWLQEISVFTQASRTAIMAVADELTYSCSLNVLDQCMDAQGRLYPCDVSPPDNGHCEVSGRAVLYVTQGTSEDESKWVPFGYLVLIFAVLRLLVGWLMCCPVEKILYNLQNLYAGISSRGILDNQLALRRVEGQLNAYMALHRTEAEEKDLIVRSIPEAPLSSKKHSGKEPINELFNDHFGSGDVQTLASGHCLEWKDVSVILHTRGTVLVDKVTGVALPGRILALMGPSG